MYILKNAWTSIKRNKGRNILMGAIILVIAVSASVTLAIKQSANNLVESYANKYDITASISMNRQNIMGNFRPGAEEAGAENGRFEFSSIPTLTKENIELYGNSEYVSSYYYTNKISMNSSNIEKASSESSIDSSRPNGMKNVESGDFSIIGYNSYEAMNDFIEGKYTITSGEVSSDFNSYNCVINEELATINNIVVGDNIILVDPNNTDLTYTLSVTGIFTERSSSEDDMSSMFSNSANTIITNTTVVEKMTSADENLKFTITPTFILTSKDIIEDYEEELKDKGFSEYYQLTTNLDTINSETSLVSNVSNFATVFLLITLIIGGVVLFVVNMINIRERKYEIGVLRTIGMKKKLVSLQFITEMMIITIAALIVGTGIGASISVPVANKLLENEVKLSENNQQDINNNFGGNFNINRPNNKVSGMANVNFVTDINAVVDFKVVIELLAIGIILTLISSSASVISISRFSPGAILKERT